MQTRPRSQAPLEEVAVVEEEEFPSMVNGKEHESNPRRSGAYMYQWSWEGRLDWSNYVC